MAEAKVELIDVNNQYGEDADDEDEHAAMNDRGASTERMLASNEEIEHDITWSQILGGSIGNILEWYGMCPSVGGFRLVTLIFAHILNRFCDIWVMSAHPYIDNVLTVHALLTDCWHLKLGLTSFHLTRTIMRSNFWRLTEFMMELL